MITPSLSVNQLIRVDDDIENALPTFAFENLPVEIRMKVHDAWRSRHIKTCKMCGRTTKEYQVKTCEKCGYTRTHRDFYCSRACQKRDWPNHKLMCREDNQADPNFGLPCTPEYNAQRRVERAMWGWLESLRTIFEWATAQAYRVSVAGERKGTCLQFNVTTSDHQTANTPFSLRTVGIRPLRSNDYVDRRAGPSDVTYMVILNKRRTLTGVVTVATHGKALFGDSTEVPTKLWPWLLAEVVHMKPDNPDIAEVLLGLLVGITSAYSRDNPSGTLFDPFRPPRIGGEWKLCQFDEWHSLIRHVLPWWTREQNLEEEKPL